MSSSSTLPKPILTLRDNITVRPWHSIFEQQIVPQANNRKIWLNLTDRFPHPYTLSDAEWWTAHNSDPANHISINFPPTQNTLNGPLNPSTSYPSNYAICLSDKPIGAVGLEALPRHPHALSLGYWLGEDYWGQGIATTVASAFLKWTFDTFPWCVRVHADAYSWNQGSAKVLRKIGMEYEGTQKLAVFKAGRYGDLVLFGAVRPGFVPNVVGDGEARQE